VEILTVAEVAEELRMGETTVRRLIADGLLERVNTGKVRRYLVSRDALDRFIAADPSVGAVPHIAPAPADGNVSRLRHPSAARQES
jgi:excisionase family DNA binding protein